MMPAAAARADTGLCGCFGNAPWHAGRFFDRGVACCCLCGRPVSEPWHPGPRLRFAYMRGEDLDDVRGALLRTRLYKNGEAQMVWVNQVDLEALVRTGIAINQAGP